MISSAAVGLGTTVAGVTAARVTGSDAYAGLAQTSTIVGASLAAQPLAWLTSRIGRSSALTFGFLVAATGAVLAGLAARTHSAGGFFLGVFLLGFATSSALATRYAAVDGATDRRRIARIMGFVFWASALGSLIGPNLITVMRPAATAGERAYPVIGALYLACAAASTRFARTRAALDNRTRPPFRSRVRAVSTAPRYRPVFTTAAVCHAVMIGFMAMASVYLERQGVSAGAIGLVMSAHLVCMYVFSPLVSTILHRLGERATFTLALGTLTAASLVFVVGSSFTVLFGAALAAVGFAWCVGFLASSACLASESDAEVRLSMQGVNDLLVNVSAGVSSLASSVVLAHFGYPALGTGMLLVVVAAVTFVSRHSDGPSAAVDA